MKLPDGYELEVSIYDGGDTWDAYYYAITDFEFTGNFKILDNGECSFEIEYEVEKEKVTFEKVIVARKKWWFINDDYEINVPTTTVRKKTITRFVSDKDFREVYYGNCVK